MIARSYKQKSFVIEIKEMKNTRELEDQATYQSQVEVVVAVVFFLCLSCKSGLSLQSTPFKTTHPRIKRNVLVE
jgi:hypothetical protein